MRNLRLFCLTALLLGLVAFLGMVLPDNVSAADCYALTCTADNPDTTGQVCYDMCQCIGTTLQCGCAYDYNNGSACASYSSTCTWNNHSSCVTPTPTQALTCAACTDWVDSGCGAPCTSGQRYDTRNCQGIPNCDSTRCVTDSNCNTCTTPAAPTGLWPRTGSPPACMSASGNLTFTWNAVTGASGYDIRIDNTANIWNGSCTNPNSGDTCVNNHSTNSYTRTVTPGNTYNFWVHSRNSCGTSGATTSGSFTVPTCTTNSNCDITMTTTDLVVGNSRPASFVASNSSMNIKLAGIYSIKNGLGASERNVLDENGGLTGTNTNSGSGSFTCSDGAGGYRVWCTVQRNDNSYCSNDPNWSPAPPACEGTSTKNITCVNPGNCTKPTQTATKNCDGTTKTIYVDYSAVNTCSVYEIQKATNSGFTTDVVRYEDTNADGNDYYTMPNLTKNISHWVRTRCKTKTAAASCTLPADDWSASQEVTGCPTATSTPTPTPGSCTGVGINCTGVCNASGGYDATCTWTKPTGATDFTLASKQTSGSVWDEYGPNTPNPGNTNTWTKSFSSNVSRDFKLKVAASTSCNVTGATYGTVDTIAPVSCATNTPTPTTAGPTCNIADFSAGTTTLSNQGDNTDIEATVTFTGSGTKRVDFSSSANARISVSPTSDSNATGGYTSTATRGSNTNAATVTATAYIAGVACDTATIVFPAVGAPTSTNTPTPTTAGPTCNITDFSTDTGSTSLPAQGDDVGIEATVTFTGSGTKRVDFSTSHAARIGVSPTSDNTSSDGYTSTATRGSNLNTATVTATAYVAGVACDTATIVFDNDTVAATNTPTPTTAAPCSCTVSSISSGAAVVNEAKRYTATATATNCTISQVDFSLSNSYASISPESDTSSPYRTWFTGNTVGETVGLTATATTNTGLTCDRTRNISISEGNSCTVTLTPTDQTINIGENLTYLATVITNVGGTVDRVIFESDNSAVATVLDSPITSTPYATDVEGVAPGTTTITARVEMGGTEECNVSTGVTVAAPSCSFSLPASIEVDKLENRNLQLSYNPSDIVGTISEVQFRSSDNSIATVNPNSDSNPVYSTSVRGQEISATPVTITADMYMYGSIVCSGSTEVTVTNPDPWWQIADGDGQVRGNVSSKIAGGCGGAGCDPYIITGTGLLSYTGTLGTGSGDVSVEDWQAEANYDSQITYGYDFFESRISDGLPQVISGSTDFSTGGSLKDGYYWYIHRGGDLTLSDPINLVDRKVVLLVEGGDLNINTEIHLDGSRSTFVVIADQNINVSPSVGGSNDGSAEVEGVFISDDKFVTGTAGDDADTQLHVRGIIVANGGVTLQRDLPDNSDSPAHLFAYGIDQTLLFPQGLSSKRLQWKEVAP